MLKKFQSSFLVVTSILALMACGGGSGSSGGSTPPPQGGGTTTPTNAAPTASISVSDMAPNEGLKTTLDASESSDPDGDSITYAWTQLSGPDLVLSAPSSAQTDISVPNLTADTSARIQLQVSDGTLTSTQEVTLTLTNVVLTPVATSTITGEQTLSYPNIAVTLPTFEYFFEKTPFLVYESAGRYIWDALGYSVDDGSILEIDSSRIESEVGKIVSAEVDQFSPTFAVLSSTKASFFSALSDSPELFSIDTAQPCDLVSEPNRRPGNIIIGKSNGGAEVVELAINSSFEATGASTILQSFGGNASLCKMQIIQSTLGDGFYNGDEKLVAFDQNTNQLTDYSIVKNNSNRMVGVTENTTVPLSLDLPDGGAVEFITSTKIDSAGIEGIALIFSNGETDGLHRLVIIGLDQAGSILQETYSWPYGVPSGISNAYVDDHQGDSLLITTEDSPHAVIFKSGGFFAGDTPYLPLIGPSYIDLGIGHGLAAPINGGSPRKLGTLVTYPDQNLIKVLQRD